MSEINPAFRLLMERLNKQAERLTADVAAGTKTQAQASAEMQDLRVQAAKDVLGVVNGFTESAETPKVDKPLLTLYAESLKRDGMTDKQVLDLVTDAAAVGDDAIREKAEAERALQIEVIEKKEAAEKAKSPEGVRETAQRIRAEQEEHAAKVRDADTILLARGMSQEDLDSGALTDAEKLRFSGVDPNAPMPERGSHMPPSSFIEA